MNSPPVEPEISRDETSAWLRSDSFRQALDESGKGRVEKAQLLRDLRQQFFTDWQSRRDVGSLDNAVRLA
jgi:hypothetical protein